MNPAQVRVVSWLVGVWLYVAISTAPAGTACVPRKTVDYKEPIQRVSVSGDGLITVVAKRFWLLNMAGESVSFSAQQVRFLFDATARRTFAFGPRIPSDNGGLLILKQVRVGHPLEYSMSQDGGLIVTMHRKGRGSTKLAFYDGTGSLVARKDHNELSGVFKATASDDGAYFAILTGLGGRPPPRGQQSGGVFLIVYDRAGNEKWRKPVAEKGYADGLAIIKAAKTVVCSTYDTLGHHWIKTFDLAGKELGTAHWVQSLCAKRMTVSENGKWLATAGAFTVSLIELQRGKPVLRWQTAKKEDPAYWFDSASVANDGTVLASRSNHGKAAPFDAVLLARSSGKILWKKTFSTHLYVAPHRGPTVFLSPDGAHFWIHANKRSIFFERSKEGKK